MSLIRLLLLATALSMICGCDLFGGDGGGDDPFTPPTGSSPLEPPPLEPHPEEPPLADNNNRALLISDFEVPGTMELYRYSVADDSMTKLNAPLTLGGDVTRFRLSPDGQSIAYIADQDLDKNYQLYIVAADGTLLNIAAATGSDAGLYWAPDSSAIAYLTAEETTLNITSPDRTVHLSLSIDQLRSKDASIKSGAIFVLESKGAISPWAPDSSNMAFIVKAPDSDQGADQRLFSLPVQNQFIVDPIEFVGPGIPGLGIDLLAEYRWSPNSQHIAVTFSAIDPPNGEISAFRIYTRDGQPLLLSEALQFYSAISGPSFRWSPDSSRISFALSPIARSSGVAIRSIDESVPINFDMSFAGSRYFGASSWSPDSSRIALINSGTRKESKVSELFTVAPDQVVVGPGGVATSPKPISHCSDCYLSAGNFFNEAAARNGTAPAWSPDSRWIAYINLADSTAYLVDTESGAIIRVSHALSHADASVVLGVSPGQLNDEGVSFDVWAPGSKHILYLSDDLIDESYDLFSTNVDGSASYRIGRIINDNVGLLADIPAYAKWAPDGSALLYISKQGEQYQLHVSTPGGSEQQIISANIDPENFEWKSLVVTADGKEWLQPADFLGYSYDQVSVACPAPAGTCSGTLPGSTYDLTGYTWASIGEVSGLFNTYGVNPPFTKPFQERYGDEQVDVAIAQDFAITDTACYGDCPVGHIYVSGMVRDAAPSRGIYIPYFHYIDETFPPSPSDLYFNNTNFNEEPPTPSDGIGVWFWRPAD